MLCSSGVKNNYLYLSLRYPKNYAHKTGSINSMKQVIIQLVRQSLILWNGIRKFVKKHDKLSQKPFFCFLSKHQLHPLRLQDSTHGG